MLPIIRTLQCFKPNCQITWIIGKLEFQLVEGLENIEFIIFDKSQGKKAYLDLYKKLRNRKFDILLHMQAALRASLASLLIKAPIKIGFDKSRAADFQRFFCTRTIDSKPRTHVLDGFFGFLQAIDIHKRVMRWDPPMPESAKTFARKILSTNQRILVINPCTSVRRNNYRNWSAKYYAAIAEYAVNAHDLKIVLTGSPAENELIMASDICQIAAIPIINLVGKTTIKQMLAILSHADIIIAPDTGPAHMGTAVNTAVIGLYVTSNPERTGPYNNLDSVVNLYPAAIENEFGKSVSEVKWGKRVRNPDAIELITISAVKKQLDTTLTLLSLNNG